MGLRAGEPRLEPVTLEQLERAERALRGDPMFADAPREVQAADTIEGWYEAGEEDRQARALAYCLIGALLLLVLGVAWLFGAVLPH